MSGAERDVTVTFDAGVDTGVTLGAVNIENVIG